MAILGLLANAVALPALVAWIFSDGPLAAATFVVGLAAVLPAVVLGLVAALALLAGRGWGRVVAIVALSLGLAVSLSYGIVWLVLVPVGRAVTGPLLGLLWLALMLALIYWCLPRQPRSYRI
ncbi:MAG: Hepatitis C virus core protein [Synechococcaceae bacterium WB8_1B_136]|nr:Hepatitis C virus core protein [Synechococcaceae bacterium WB8_1B_136]